MIPDQLVVRATHGVLDPNLSKAVESQTLHVRDGRVRQDRGLGGSDLSSGRVLIAGRDGLGRSQGQCANKGGQSLLGEHDFELCMLSLPIANNTVDAREKRSDQPGVGDDLIPGASNAENQSATRSVHGIHSSLTSLEAPSPRHPHRQERPEQATLCSTLHSKGELLAGFPMDKCPHRK